MRFDHVICDSPWAYNNRLSGKGRTVFGSGASGKYRVEKAEDLATFAVPDIAANPCHLHMWTTGPFAEEAYWLMRQWGFMPKTWEFVWIKTKAMTINRAMQIIFSRGVLQFMKEMVRRLPGHYTASNAEIVILGTSGKGVHLPKYKLETQVIFSPPLEHSRKPDDVHEWIERNYPGHRYLELFARREREGWVTLGDEIDGRDLRDSLPALAERRM